MGGPAEVELVVPLTIALVGAFVATGVVIAVYSRHQVLDIPNERSSHVVPTVRGGGLGVAMALLVATVAVRTTRSEDVDLVLLGTALFTAVGLADDLLNLRALFRLGLQLIAAAITLPALFAMTELTTLQQAGLAVVAFIALVGFVNAFNFMDGINGISGVHAVVMGAAYYLIGREADVSVLCITGALVAAGGAGFLPWNLRERCFLGDAGSYAFGAWISLTFLVAVRQGVALDLAIAPLVIYGADTGVTLVRRVARGDKWYESHREHVYQRLTEAGGLSHRVATAFVATCTATVALLGLAANRMSGTGRMGIWVLALLVVVGYLLSGGAMRRLRAVSIRSAQHDGSMPADTLATAAD